MRIWEAPPDIEQIRRIDAADREFALACGVLFIVFLLGVAIGYVIA